MILGLRTVIYHVPDLHFTRAGANLKAPVQAVGGGIRVATITDPFGNLVGLIENPHFVAA